MTITYQDGRSDEAIILSRTGTEMRVILRNSDDVLELKLLSGTWVTEQCDPVTLEFASRTKREVPMREEDFICPADLAAHLIGLLMTDSEEEQPEAPVVEHNQTMAAAARVV